MNQPIGILEDIPTKTLNILKKNKITTIKDIVELMPKKYTDYRTIKPLEEISNDEYVAVCGVLRKVEDRTTSSSRRHYLSLRITTDSGKEFSVLDFGKIYLFDSYLTMTNQRVVACGKMSYSENYGYIMSPPDMVIKEALFKPFIKKTYKKFSGISPEMLQKIMFSALKKIEDPLNKDTIEHFNIPDYKDALYKLHYAKTENDIKIGRKRLLLNDMVYLAASLEEKKETSQIQGPILKNRAETDTFIKNLPFRLTNDQMNAVNVYFNKAKEEKRNNILLQGDVGCGKTIVAAICMMLMAENGFQSVLMAPRGVLANQHYNEILNYAQLSGYECVFLHSGMKAKERKDICKKIKNGDAQFIIGTHSCISEDVEYSNLGLVITDEEHLFGVEQKNAIERKALSGCHRISMSATPIPRTIANVIYGQSHEIVNIKEKPSGRKEIATKRTTDRKGLFNFIKKEISNDHRCYVVCPAIEDDENGKLVSIDTIKKEYQKFFGTKNISIVNGKMKKEEIASEMSRFVDGETKILISTTVIEVGVNVPTATVMVIEQADRFGLATLHQLRGRVGRSALQSYCFLISSDPCNERLKTLERTNDGFEIAEADLTLRGTGNLIGVEQSGFNKYVEEMITNPEMYRFAQKVARYCMDNCSINNLHKFYNS